MNHDAINAILDRLGRFAQWAFCDPDPAKRWARSIMVSLELVSVIGCAAVLVAALLRAEIRA